MLKKYKLAIISVSSALVLLLAAFLFLYFNWNSSYRDRLVPKTYLGGHDLSGLSFAEVKSLLLEQENLLRQSGLEFKNGDTSVIYPLLAESASADIPDASLRYSDAITFNHEETLRTLFGEKNNSFWHYLGAVILNLQNENSAHFYYSADTVSDWVNTSFPELTVKPSSAYFSLVIENGQEILINNQEKIGREVNYVELGRDLSRVLGRLENSPLQLKTKTAYPRVKQSDLEPLRPEVQKFIAAGDFNIQTKADETEIKEVVFKVPIAEIISWISSEELEESVAGDGFLENEFTIGFNREKIEDYLSVNVAPKINKEVVLPRFEMEGGRVTSWQKGEDGYLVNLEESGRNIAAALSSFEPILYLKIDTVSASELATEKTLNIKELLGTGHSNFAGSPANRRHNIAVGAKAVHGLLIEPEKEFSLVAALGDISAKTGYLPELVIKGNKTIPEYGGGLCQVATTLFRSTLSSGLPVTARRNHSYRVGYYEPAGTDASVYDPWPDFRFVNDTGNHVLIQSRIEGNDIYFDFWGTSDGRVATTTAPVIYNIVRPPATKFIETEDLKPGEKKCTEKPHNGADAYFDYTVIYPEGATTTPRQEVRFRSHYVPWQEVCLIGKALPEEAPKEAESGGVSETPAEAPPSE